METENQDLIYDLSESPSEISDPSETSQPSENSDPLTPDTSTPDTSTPDTSDTSTPETSEAEQALQAMVAEMGAETLLDIIRDNRNAAIRQILAEVEAQRPPLQSGVSAARPASSIFDLAALA